MNPPARSAPRFADDQATRRVHLHGSLEASDHDSSGRLTHYSERAVWALPNSAILRVADDPTKLGRALRTVTVEHPRTQPLPPSRAIFSCIAERLRHPNYCTGSIRSKAPSSSSVST